MTPRDALGPGLGIRWWLVAAGVVLGLSAGIKWSGLYAVAAFGLLAFGLDVQARRAAGVRSWFTGGVLRGGVPQFLFLVPAALAGYLAGWASWFASPRAYLRQWAVEQRAAGAEVPAGWAGDALASLWHYHRQMYDFHRGLSSEHSYMSSPFGWIVQYRPTSFYWPDALPEGTPCEAERCIQAITSIGNPILWWLAALALVVVLWAAIVRCDVRAWIVLAGYAATYLPWFQYLDRTIFTFYTVALVPYVVMALTFGIGWALGIVRLPVRGAPATDLAVLDAPEGRPLGRRRAAILAAILLLIAAVSAFYWPIWTGMTVDYDFWRMHMWLPSWI